MNRTNCVIRHVVFLTCYECGTEIDITDHNLETGRVQVRNCPTCKRKTKEEAFAAGVRAVRAALLGSASMTEVLDDGSTK